MEAIVSTPLQGLRRETGWLSLTQANGLGLTDRFPAQALKGRFKEPTVTFYSLR